MSRSNEYSKLFSDLMSSNRKLAGSNWFSAIASEGQRSATTKIATVGELKKSSLNASLVAHSIDFGNAPTQKSSATSQASSFDWGVFVKNTVSGGVSSGLPGGLMDAIGPIGGLISKIAGLFGGGGAKTVPPLRVYHAPESQDKVVYLSSRSSGEKKQSTVTTSVQKAAETTSVTKAATSGTTVAQSNLTTEHIVSTVKQAILSSSSLNDVIAEI